MGRGEKVCVKAVASNSSVPIHELPVIVQENKLIYVSCEEIYSQALYKTTSSN